MCYLPSHGLSKRNLQLFRCFIHSLYLNCWVAEYMSFSNQFTVLGLIGFLAYRIYSPITRFAYKSVGIFDDILEVFAVDPPISRNHFSTELVNNFRLMCCCLYWLQIKIFNKRRRYSIFCSIIKFTPMLSIILLVCHWNSAMQYRHLTS
jgi:hypothetical protein